MARPQDGPDRLGDTTLDEDDARASDDGARDTSISSACGGSGGFASARGGFGGSAPGGLVVLAADVTHAPPARPPRLMSMHAEVLAAAATMSPSDCLQPLVEAPPAGSMPAPTATRKVVTLAKTRTPGASRGLELGTRGERMQEHYCSWNKSLLKSHL